MPFSRYQSIKAHLRTLYFREVMVQADVFTLLFLLKTRSVKARSQKFIYMICIKEYRTRTKQCILCSEFIVFELKESSVKQKNKMDE